MVDEKKIADIRKRIKKTIKDQKMHIDNESDYSGSPQNTVTKDLEERLEDEKRNKDKK
jgi:hypothetical protein